MLESRFVEQNKQKWSDLEKLLSKPSKEPEKLSDYFVQVSEDLSYARTHYTNRSVRLYLNQLTQTIFSLVYKNKKDRWTQFANFWKYELPATMYHARKEFLVSFLVFVLSVGIGVFSCKNDPSFAALILGDNYVAMTNENIAKGDPMAVYKKAKHASMFLGITINNVRVALIVFVLGIFLGLGTAGFLMYNGIMVGTFQYYFIQRGLFQESFLTIWLHGALEISSIILAAVAGFSLGKGLMFPNTYSRFQSFQIGARKGIKIMLGIIPLFVIAAFIEGFLTRYTEMPNAIRLILILLSFGFIILYFVLYPMMVINNPKLASYLINEKPEALELQSDNTYGIRSFGEMFSAALAWIISHFKVVSWSVIASSFLFSAAWVFFVRPGNSTSFYNFTSYAMINNLMQYFDFQEYGWKSFIPLSLALGIIQTAVYVAYSRERHKEELTNWKKVVLQFFQNYLQSGLLLLLLFIPSSLGMVLFVALLPIQIFWSTTSMNQDSNPLISLFNSFNLQSASWKMVMGQYFIMFVVTLILSIVGTSPLVWVYFQVMTWNIADNNEMILLLSKWLVSFLTVFTILFSYAFVFVNSLFLYENLHEINSGDILRKKITELRVKKGYVH